MKKKSLLLALFTLIFITGCFGKEQKELKPIEVLEKTVQNLGEVKSLEVVATLNAKVIQEGATVEISVPLSVAVSEAKDEMDMKVSLGENPFIGSLEAYFIANTESKKLDLYFPSSLYDMMLGIKSEESKWLYTTTTLEENEDSKSIISDEDLEKIKNIDYKKVIGDNFVYVDTNEGINHYQLIINNDLIQRLAVELGEEVESIKEEIKLEVYIDAENYNITKIGSDLKNMLTENASEEELEKFSSLEEFSFTMEFKNVNNTTVTIPEDVKNDAIDLEKYTMDLLDSIQD